MGVRREKVVLEIDDRFSPGAARAAAAAALLAREVNAINRNGSAASSSMDRTTTSTDRYSTSLAALNRHLRESGTLMGGLSGNGRNGLGGFNNNANSAGRSINQLTGRLRLFVDLAAMLGPALVPIGALGVPAISGLASQLGIAAAAGGTAVLAFQGVADAFKAVKKAADAPTFENIRAAQIAMEGLAPATQEFVTKLSEMRGEFAGFRNAAAQGLFSELNADFDHMEGLLNRLTPVVNAFGTATGKMLGDGLTSLDSARWQDFYDFLAREAGPAMEQMGQTLGNFGHGLAELWMGMDPFNDSFTGWMLGVSQSFDSWAEGLAQTEGFTEFLDYVKTTGPQVGDTMGAIGNAFLQIAEAAAPVGGPVLQVLEAVADVFAGIADSDIGTPLIAAAAGMAALSRASALFGATSRTVAAQQAAVMGRVTATSGAFRTLGRDVRTMSTQYAGMGRAQSTLLAGMSNTTGAAQRTRATLAQVGKTAATSAAGIGLMAVAMSDLDNKAGISNTAMLGLAGTMIGGPWGAAIGVAIGGTMDLAAANDDLEGAVERAKAAMRSGGPEQMQAALTSLRSEIQGASEDSESLSDFLSFKRRDEGVSYFEETGGAIRGFVNLITGAGDEASNALADLESHLNNPGLGSIFASGIGMTTDAFNAGTQSAQAYAAAVERVNDILSGRADWRSYTESLREAADAVKENGKGLDIFTEKGSANQAALDGIAASAIKLSERLKGMERVRFLDKARDNFIDTAVAMGKGRKAAAELATEMGLLDKTQASPQVNVNTEKAQSMIAATASGVLRLNSTRGTATALLNDLASGRIKGVQGLVNKYGMTRAQAQALLRDLASGAISSVQAQLNALNGRTATTYIRTVHQTVMGPSPLGAGGPRMTRAEGGPIYGPGTKTSDSVPVMASNGEFMMSAAAVDYYGLDAMFAMNARKLAEGGSVDGKKRASAAKSFDLSGGLGVAGVRREMHEFERALNKMGVRTGRAFDHLGKRAEVLSASWIRANKALDDAKTRRDDIRSSAVGSFDNDLFGNGLAGLKMQAEADRNDATAMTALLKGLRAKGLNGPLYDMLAGSGDLNTAQQMKNLSRTEISQYERLVAQRSSAQTSLGNQAVVSVNQEIAAHTRTLSRLGRQIEGIEKAVERGSRAGAHAGALQGTRLRERDRSREVSGRARAGR